MDERVLFHLTGTRSGSLASLDGLALRPALFARFRDLTRLRYDFPLVLVAAEGDAPFALTLSGIVDGLLGEIAPRGIAGERLRRSVLRLERELRTRVAHGASATLGSLWDVAAERLVEKGGEPVRTDLARARAALRVDGDLLGCDATTPARFVAHAWRLRQLLRSRRTRREIDALVMRLADLVRADFLRSESGRRPATLRAAVGATHRELFDFDAMARLLAAPSGPTALPERRRRRIEECLAVLRAQRFFGDDAYGFAFDRVDAALDAYRERLPELAALARATLIAELEVQGRYVEATHDAYFATFGAGSLSTEDRALFPDYLVCLDAHASGAVARAQVMEGLTSGLPLRIVLATDDAFGVGAQLATTAMGLGDVFVLQSPAAHLPRMASAVRGALSYQGAALFSVFSGAIAGVRGPSPYLVSAAALESRAFPAFSYDPAAGPDWAHRFSLESAPQAERTWPVHDLSYAEASRQRVVERIAFTPADLALCDPRLAEHFAGVPRERWDDALVPVDEFLHGTPAAPAFRAPFVYAVDDEDRLQRLVVDARLVGLTERCADAWLRLRELDDLKRAHAPGPNGATSGASLAATVSIAAAPPAAAVPGSAAPSAAPAAAPAPEAAEASSDDPYIETVRCATCNECTNINPRMFKYNENKQAFIADASAGTYRELVEAAESCQVAIIHPGKPRDPNEPGLAELVERAAAFR